MSGGMNYRHVVVPEQRLIVLRFTGEVSLGDVMRSSEVLWRDPGYDRTFHIISDLSAVSPRANPRDVVTLRDFYKRPEASIGRWAMIFSDPILTALGLLFRSAAAIDRRIGVFSTWEGACDFLNVEVSERVLD